MRNSQEIKISKEKRDDMISAIQNYFEKELKKTIQENNLVSVYKELHALLVELAKNYCRKKPDCTTCPIQTLCEKSL